MKSKIRVLQESRILLDGAIELNISEDLDGDWNLTIKELNNKRLRIGIPQTKCTFFRYFSEIVKELKS